MSKRWRQEGPKTSSDPLNLTENIRILCNKLIFPVTRLMVKKQNLEILEKVWKFPLLEITKKSGKNFFHFFQNYQHT